MGPSLQKKVTELQRIVSSLESVIVAFSGGVDSTLLLKVCRDILKKNVIGVTIASELVPPQDITQVRKYARFMRVKNIVVKKELLKYSAIKRNARNRCYICKKEIMGSLLQIAKRYDCAYVVEGSNSDDARVFRPGRKALRELGIRSPLAEAGLTKKDIRALLRKGNVPTWDKKSASCLATRFSYGSTLTRKKLKGVANVEKKLTAKGFASVRVRVHNDTLARIEVAPQQTGKAVDAVDKHIVRCLKKIGIKHVSVDAEGFRSGSMDS